MDPDYDTLNEQREHYERLLIALAKNGGYNEGPNRWLIPTLVSLTAAFILGGVGMAIAFSALKQEVSDLKEQVAKVEKIIEPRYRGG